MEGSNLDPQPRRSCLDVAYQEDFPHADEGVLQDREAGAQTPGKFLLSASTESAHTGCEDDHGQMWGMASAESTGGVSPGQGP